MIGKCFASSSAALLVAMLSSQASASTTITVVELGSILEESISLPGTKTQAGGNSFQDYFEFTVPENEYISASVSISGPTTDQIPTGDGSLTLFTCTSNCNLAPSVVPSGTIIESELISAPANGGQSGFIGTLSEMGDLVHAGSYYVEISGTNGGTLQLAVDGNLTAAAPEPTTWAMMLLGFLGLGFAGYRQSRRLA